MPNCLAQRHSWTLWCPQRELPKEWKHCPNRPNCQACTEVAQARLCFMVSRDDVCQSFWDQKKSVSNLLVIQRRLHYHFLSFLVLFLPKLRQVRHSHLVKATQLLIVLVFEQTFAIWYVLYPCNIDQSLCMQFRLIAVYVHLVLEMRRVACWLALVKTWVPQRRTFHGGTGNMRRIYYPRVCPTLKPE
jgi:hypothetical protein